MLNKSEQENQFLSVKWIIIFIAMPMVIYFLVKIFNINPVQIIFGILIIVKVIIPLGIGAILFIYLISLFSDWIKGKAPTEKHKAKCRICGEEFEPPFGNKLHTIHMKTVHGDFIEKEKTPRRWLSLLIAILSLEGLSLIYASLNLYNFTFTNLILFNLRIPMSAPLIDSLMFTAAIILGVYYYRILQQYRKSYQQKLQLKEKVYKPFEKAPVRMGEQNKQEPRESEALLSELEELIKKAYESEDEKTK